MHIRIYPKPLNRHGYTQLSIYTLKQTSYSKQYITKNEEQHPLIQENAALLRFNDYEDKCGLNLLVGIYMKMTKSLSYLINQIGGPMG